MPPHRRWRPERATARRSTAGVSSAASAVAVAFTSTLLLECLRGPGRGPASSVTPAACAALAAELPKRLAGQDRRTTEPDSPSTAAWGDPPISLRCGVDRPAAYQPTSELVAIDTIDWLPEPFVGRRPLHHHRPQHGCRGDRAERVCTRGLGARRIEPGGQPSDTSGIAARRSASTMRASISSAYSTPAACHTTGYIDVEVKPGIVLGSLSNTRPSGSRNTSTRAIPRNPTARRYDAPGDRIASRSSSESFAGTVMRGRVVEVLGLEVIEVVPAEHPQSRRTPTPVGRAQCPAPRTRSPAPLNGGFHDHPPVVVPCGLDRGRRRRPAASPG